MSDTDLTPAERLYYYRLGLSFGRKEINSEKNKATKALVQAKSAVSGQLNKFFVQLIQKGDTSVIPHLQRAHKELEELQAQLKEARAPYNEKARPLSKAIRFVDEEAKEMLEEKAGTPIKPIKRVPSEIKAIVARRSVKKEKPKKKSK